MVNIHLFGRKGNKITKKCSRLTFHYFGHFWTDCNDFWTNCSCDPSLLYGEYIEVNHLDILFFIEVWSG